MNGYMSKQEKLRNGAREIVTLRELKEYIDDFTRDMTFEGQGGVWIAEVWKTDIGREVRERCASTHDHIHNHRASMGWGECHRCVTRDMGQHGVNIGVIHTQPARTDHVPRPTIYIHNNVCAKCYQISYT